MKSPLPERDRKRIVIDADIARAAKRSKSPEASNCFDFLVALQQCHHKAVFSGVLWGEWLDNHSRYSWRWMTEMRGRKLVVRIGNPTDDGLREKIDRLAGNVAELDAMNKDIHLLEAALATDKIVASKEVEAHDLFEDVCSRVGEIRDVMWVNPVVEEESCIVWLKQGAPR